MTDIFKDKIAWLHADVITLNTDDLVELKYCLKRLIVQASEAHEMVEEELQRHRRPVRRHAA